MGIRQQSAYKITGLLWKGIICVASLAYPYPNLGKVFYSQYDNTGTGAFEYLTVLAIAKAVNAYRERHNVSEDYKVSITIDGLKGSEGLRVGRELRELGIKSRKVRGARDESEPFIRLADRLAGLVRDAETGEQQDYKTRRRQLEKQRIITEL
jgi:hypothetical protein